jgi:hypothetical protein
MVLKFAELQMKKQDMEKGIGIGMVCFVVVMLVEVEVSFYLQVYDVERRYCIENLRVRRPPVVLYKKQNLGSRVFPFPFLLPHIYGGGGGGGGRRGGT